jgi:hypothetical protein
MCLQASCVRTALAYVPLHKADQRPRLQGRPLTSFQHHDMSLTAASPSVLGEPGSARSLVAPQQSLGAAMSIKTPRRVLSTFSVQSPADSGANPAPVQTQPRAAAPLPPNIAPPSPEDSCTSQAAPMTATQRRNVQWRGENQVRLYVPTPRSPASPPNSHKLAPTPGAGKHLSSFPLPSLADSAADASSPPPPRHASNLSECAGTFNEILESGLNPLASYATDNTSDAGLGSGAVSRRDSNMSAAMGMFDSLLDDDGHVVPGSSAALSGSLIRLDEQTHDLSDLSGQLPASRGGGGGGGGGSSVAARGGGAFDQVLASGLFQGQRPADAIPRPDSAHFFAHLLDAGLPDDKHLGGDSPSSDHVVSRCASNMAQRAGTFDELVPDVGLSGVSTGMSVASVATGCLPSVLLNVDTDAPSDDEGDALCGAISRRTTNMAAAAGHFDALVDEDGDELPPEEYSDAEGDDGSGFGGGVAAERGNSLARVGLGAQSWGGPVARGASDRGPAPSFAGFVSDADVLRAAGGSPARPPLSQRDVSADVDLFSAAQHAPAERGAASVRNIRGTAGAEGDPPTAWNTIAGALPSDVAMSDDEEGMANPAAGDRPPLAPEPSACTMWGHSSMTASQPCAPAHSLLHVSLMAACNGIGDRRTRECNAMLMLPCSAWWQLCCMHCKPQQQANHANTKRHTPRRSGGRSAFSSLRLDEHSAPLLGAPDGQPSGSYAALLPPSVSTLRKIATPRGLLRTPTDYAIISFSGAPSRAASSVAADVAGAASGVPRALSIRTARKPLAVFAADDGMATGSGMPRSAVGAQHSLAATASFMSESAPLSVRTPRKVYGTLGGVDGAAATPPPPRFDEAPVAEPVVTTHEWLAKVMSMNTEQQQQQPSAMSMLSTQEWAERLAAKRASGKGGGNTGAGQNQRFMPEESLAGTTLFGAFRPSGELGPV